MKFVKLMAKTNDVEAEVYAAINTERGSRLFYFEDEHRIFVYNLAEKKGMVSTKE